MTGKTFIQKAEGEILKQQEQEFVWLIIPDLREFYIFSFHSPEVIDFLQHC